jgi:ornithine carbamoyltransferase
MPSDFLSLADYSTEELRALLDLADLLKVQQRTGVDHRELKGKVVAMVFEKPSLRTRMTFEAGIFQLGAHAIFYPDKLGARESEADVARNLTRWVDAIVARTFRHESVEIMAEYATVPVVNALTDRLHPCQVLADAQTLREHRGGLDGLKIAFVGDGNNMFASWANLATRFPFDLTLVCPEGYEGDEAIHAFAAKEAKGSVSISNDPAEGVRGVDVIYTDVWASMGQEDEKSARALVFAPYQVNAEMMSKAKSDALFMHCLPAHRGEEVTDEVIESDQSIVFDEAENRLHAQKAILVALMKNRG